MTLPSPCAPFSKTAWQGESRGLGHDGVEVDGHLDRSAS